MSNYHSVNQVVRPPLRERITWRGVYWTIGGLLLIVWGTLLVVYDLRIAWEVATTNYDQCMWNIDFTGQEPATLAGCVDFIGWSSFFGDVKDILYTFDFLAIALVVIYIVIVAIRGLFHIESPSRGFVTLERFNTTNKLLKFMITVGVAVAIYCLFYYNFLPQAGRFTTTACYAQDFVCGQAWNWDGFIAVLGAQLVYVTLIIGAGILLYQLIITLILPERSQSHTYV